MIKKQLHHPPLTSEGERPDRQLAYQGMNPPELYAVLDNGERKRLYIVETIVELGKITFIGENYLGDVTIVGSFLKLLGGTLKRDLRVLPIYSTKEDLVKIEHELSFH